MPTTSDGGVHVIPEYFVFVGDHVSHVDAHAELHNPIRGEAVPPLCPPEGQEYQGTRSADEFNGL
jgi:hypothetical protein